jgi:hypothetical protein
VSTNDQYLDLIDVHRRLIVACGFAGSQKKWAEDNGISQAYVSDVLNGRREPGQSICSALGLVRVVRYVEKDKQKGKGK